MLRIGRDKHIHQFSPENEPAAYVQSGARLLVETWDGLEGATFSGSSQAEPVVLPERDTNPSTGPVYVDGARPGDALEVEIHDIRMTTPGYFWLHGAMLEAGGSGVQRVLLETQGGGIAFEGRTLPAQPMLGVIGTCPAESRWSYENGNHGGNMDTRVISAGAKVLLPVFVEGRLLALGDAHAAQGDGEAFGQGLEIGAEVELTVSIVKDASIHWPVVFNKESIACVVSGEDIAEACYTAIHEMTRNLSAWYGLGSQQAGVLIALYGNLALCQIVNPLPTVRLEIGRKHIERFACEALGRFPALP